MSTDGRRPPIPGGCRWCERGEAHPGACPNVRLTPKSETVKKRVAIVSEDRYAARYALRFMIQHGEITLPEVHTFSGGFDVDAEDDEYARALVTRSLNRRG